MMPNHEQPRTREALYCRSTGQRLAPDEGLEPAAGSPIAIAVFDDGNAIPLFGDSLLGRTPELDRRVLTGSAEAIVVEDPSRQISRCHVLLRFRQWDIEVIDLGSRNGTSVSTSDGDWIDVVPGLGNRMVDGQRVRLASRTITIHHLRR